MAETLADKIHYLGGKALTIKADVSKSLYMSGMVQKEIYSTPALLNARNWGIPMNRHGEPEEIGKAAFFLEPVRWWGIVGQHVSFDSPVSWSMTE